MRRREFAVKVAVTSTAQVAGGTAAAGALLRWGREAAPGVRPDRRMRTDGAGETLARHNMRRALARHQAKLTEEVTSLHPPQVEHLAVGLLQ